MAAREQPAIVLSNFRGIQQLGLTNELWRKTGADLYKPASVTSTEGANETG